MKKTKLSSVKTTGLGYPNIPVEQIPDTRDELYESDRGETEYIQSKKSLTEHIRLPITFKGWETLIDIVTKVAGIPNDDRANAKIFGFVHHLPDHVNYTTIGEMVNALLRDCAIDVTWQLDQKIKERIKEEAEAKKAAQTKSVSLAKDTDVTHEGTPVHGA